MSIILYIVQMCNIKYIKILEHLNTIINYNLI